jgi:hypothetical protein
MSMKNFYQIVLLPILVAFTMLVAYYGHVNQKNKYNVWHTERETNVTFTYTFVDYYQNEDDYKRLEVARSSSQSTKPGHSYQGWWKFTNISDKPIKFYLRHYLYPMDYIKYVNSNSVPDVIILYPGEQVMLSIKGYIDPSIMITHDDQPYASSINNRLEVSLIDFRIRDEIRSAEKYENNDPSPDGASMKAAEIMPYKWYINN